MMNKAAFGKRLTCCALPYDTFYTELFTMKKSFTLILLCAATYGYSQNKQRVDTILSIKYNWFSQLENFNLSIDNSLATYQQTLRYSNSITKTFRAQITLNSWNEIVYWTSLINLDSLPLLTAPSSDRGVDGAPYAKLSIHTTNNVYETRDFDGGHPMKELWNLLYFIDRIINVPLINCNPYEKENDKSK